MRLNSNRRSFENEKEVAILGNKIGVKRAKGSREQRNQKGKIGQKSQNVIKNIFLHIYFALTVICILYFCYITIN